MPRLHKLILLVLQELTQKTFSEYKKSQVSMDLIRGAIMDNDFMKNLETSQIKVGPLLGRKDNSKLIS